MGIKREINKIEKDIKKDIQYAEKWMYEKRKFLIKLLWIVGGLALLLILSNIYLRTNGFG